MPISIIRTIFLYFFVSIALRVMGKKQVGQLEPVEFVIILMLSELASIPMQDMKIPLLYSIVPIVTLTGLEMLLSAISLKFRFSRVIFDGRPSILIKNGVINIKEMQKSRYNVDELFVEMRSHGFSDIREIQYAVLETSGQLSVIPHSKNRPVTPEDLDLSPAESGYPNIVINDGVISEKNLACAGIDQNKLNALLKKNKITDIKQVFFAVADSNGDFYFQLKEDKP